MSLQFFKHRSLSEFSTFGIGGPISFFSEVKTFEEMKSGVLFAQIQKLPFLVIGKGSNCLFDDAGFNGVVLLNKIDFCSWEKTFVSVGSGYSFSLLGIQSAKRSMSGLEFASGIPATVGGAIFMNAGANGRETFECLESVTVLDHDLEIREIKKECLAFGYRHSSFQKDRRVILAAKFKLIPDSSLARDAQLRILDYRMKTQPYKDKSIGCIFRNPNSEVSAGLLIDQCGLKGQFKGGAQVSCVHANFIVNTGGATTKDVLDLIQHIQKVVYEKTQVVLEPEIRVVSHEI